MLENHMVLPYADPGLEDPQICRHHKIEYVGICPECEDFEIDCQIEERKQ